MPNFFTAGNKNSTERDGPERPKAIVLSFPDRHADREKQQTRPDAGPDTKKP
jgi:hypothetical protein